MKIISFGWTWPALVNGAKSVTRRGWDPRYAAMFHAGEVVYAFDRSPRFRGHPIAKIRLTADPVLELDSLAPDGDYEAEGFAFFAEHPELLPKAAREQARVTLSREAFDQWRKGGGKSWVIRFEIVEVYGKEEQP